MRNTHRAHGSAYPLMGGVSGYAVHKGAQQEDTKGKVEDEPQG
jgi:hypothetical protein